jgi:hypothetical protein
MAITSNQPSLRAFAAMVGVTHAAIGAAVRGGRLQAGVRLDGERVTIIDAAAAACEWRAIHVEKMPSMGLPPGRPRKAPAPDPLAAEVHDAKMDELISIRALFFDRDASHLLVSALAAALLDAVGDRDRVEAVVGRQLHGVADLHASDAAEIDRAGEDLVGVLDMLGACAAELTPAGESAP